MGDQPAAGDGLRQPRPALASGSWANWYVWIIGPVAGGIIGAVIYATVFLKDKELATP